MIALYIFLGIIAFFALLMLIPVSVSFGYDGKNIFVYLKILFIKFDILKKVDIQKPDGQVKEYAEKHTEKIDQAEKEKSKISDIFRQLKATVLIFIKKSIRHLHIKLEDFDLTVATDDAAKTAVLAGALSGSAMLFFTFLEENTRFRAKKELYLGVKPDFLSEKTKFRIKLKISALLVELLAILLPTYLAYTKNKPTKKASKK